MAIDTAGDLQLPGREQVGTYFILNGRVGNTAFHQSAGLVVGIHQTQLDQGVLAPDQVLERMPGRQCQHFTGQTVERYSG